MTARLDMVVLAAGRGSRLKALGDRTPKWLLQVGGGTIAERQLAGFTAAGVDPESLDLHVLTGHAVAAIAAYGATPGVPAFDTIHNHAYVHVNKWLSLLVALEALEVDDDTRVAVCNADLFAAPSFFASFVEAATTTQREALIAVDLQRELTDESMKVAARTGSDGTDVLDAIGKVGVDAPVGEYVGMLMARGSALTALRARLTEFTADAERTNEWYERAVGLDAAAGVPWTIWPTPSSDWVEIDDEQDLALANALPA